MAGNFSKKNNIVFIGTGKIAYSLAAALIKNGYKINGVFSRTHSSAKKFSEKYSIKNYNSSLDIISKKSRIFFIAVPDSQIKPVAEKISKINLDFSKLLFIHLSGAYDSTLLSSLNKKGSAAASFHIMQTFPSKKTVPIKNSCAAIETENIPAKKYLINLSENIGLNHFVLTKPEKIQYHLAGVFTSNFFVANLFAAQILFDEIKNNNENFIKILEPIIRSTLKNIKEKGAENSLSGPVERGDIETIKKHLKFLSDFKNKVLKRSYISQSLMALKCCESKNGRLNNSQKMIEKLLNE